MEDKLVLEVVVVIVALSLGKIETVQLSSTSELRQLRYCGSSCDCCRTDQCQADYGTCSDTLPSGFTGSARPSGNYAVCPASSVTVTSTVAQDIQILTRTVTSISTSTTSQDPVTIYATVTLRASAAVTVNNTVTQSFTGEFSLVAL
jgi:hypothetical protein